MKRRIFVLAMWQFLICPFFLICWAEMQTPMQNEATRILVSDNVRQDQQPKRQRPSDFALFDQPPQPIKRVQPVYPPEAMKAGIQGVVWVKLWVDEAGDVREATVTKSDVSVLNKAATVAALEWKFKPAMLKSKPIATWVAIPFSFTVSGSKEKAKVEQK